MRHAKPLRVHIALLLLAPCSVMATDSPAPLTPQQLINQVREQQAEIGESAPKLMAVPSVSDLPVSTPRPIRHQPTLEERATLIAQLKDLDSALKIKDITERNVQRASDAIAARGQMLFTYSPGSLYEVEAATFHETAMALQPGESLTGKELPTAGDTARWTIAVTRSGTAPNESVILIVKPLEAGLETNMTITTNRRLYTVLLKSSERSYMPLVGWLYPQDEAREREERKLTAEKAETQAEAISVEPEALNFNCAITGSRVAWRPVRAYDDGSKTYLQMNPEMRNTEAPAIFVMDGKTPLLVNFRIKHSIYIVDRLFDKAQLRIGPKTAVDVNCVHQLASR
jgi:type IV secretion system protein TrbG